MHKQRRSHLPTSIYSLEKTITNDFCVGVVVQQYTVNVVVDVTPSSQSYSNAHNHTCTDILPCMSPFFMSLPVVHRTVTQSVSRDGASVTIQTIQCLPGTDLPCAPQKAYVNVTLTPAAMSVRVTMAVEGASDAEVPPWTSPVRVLT